MSSSLVNGPIAVGVVAPIDDNASNPPISFGGSALNNSGTGLYGMQGEIAFAINGSQMLSITSNGLTGSASPYNSTGSLILKASASAVSGAIIMAQPGAPVDGTTGDNVAGTGSLYINTTAGALYIQTGLITNPVWVLIGPLP